MLGQSRCFFNSAKWISIIWRQGIHRALVTGCSKRNDDTCLSLEAFSASIDQEASNTTISFFSCYFFGVIDLMHHGVDPASRLYVIKSSDDDLELPEEIFIKLLYWISVCFNFTPFNTIHDELGRYVRLVLINICAAEQKLSVQVCQVDLIQVNHIDIFYSRESQIF